MVARALRRRPVHWEWSIRYFITGPNRSPKAREKSAPSRWRSVGCEPNCRQKQFSTRLRRAQFRTTKTLEQFDFARLPHLNRALVHDLATGRYLQEKAPVLIVGRCGTGKSHLAQALGHCAVRQGVDVVFATCASLTQSLNAARATGAYERKLASLAKVPLLIIDDFGLKPLRAPFDEDLHDLI